MYAMYAFVSGPLAWITFIVFLGGLLLRIVQLFRRIHKTEPFIYSYMSWKFAWRSILRWLIPYGTASWRSHPIVTPVTFLFHICLLATPLFLSAHVVLLTDAWDLGWATLPNTAADVMTIVVAAGCLFFLIRRFSRSEVRFVTNASDIILLVLVAAPFVSGFLVYHQWVGNIMGVTIGHILAGEILLMVVPFTRLSHMIFAFLTRAYTGSEFGKVRHARDW